MEPKSIIHNDFCTDMSNKNIQNILSAVTDPITEALLRSTAEQDDLGPAAQPRQRGSDNLDRYTIDMFTKRNTSLSKEIKQFQSAESDLLRQQGKGNEKKQAAFQITPTTQHILESYPLLSPAEKNRLWKFVMKKATVYRSPDD